MLGQKKAPADGTGANDLAIRGFTMIADRDQTISKRKDSMTDSIRLQPRTKYLTIPADIAQAHISLKAKGQLLSFLAGNFAEQDETAIKELRMAGYIRESQGSLLVVEAPEQQVITRKRNTPTKIPDNWQPGPKAIAFLKSHGVTPSDIAEAISNFRSYWIGTGTKRADWDLTFIKNPKINYAISRVSKPSTTENWWAHHA